MAVAHDTGTHAVIKSAHLDLLTPLVSLLGLFLKLHHLTTLTNEIKKNIINEIKKNHNQC
jgi:hypothetical protein